MRMRCLLLILLLTLRSSAEETVKKALIRDITSIEGVRENSLLGYGIVVGLRGTGDKQQTLFTTQTLANMLQRMGVQVPSGTIKVNNVAGVFVTATLPAFASPGTRLDVTVSSTGDAKSLEGGLLLLTPLYGRWKDLWLGARCANSRRLQCRSHGKHQAVKPSNRSTYPGGRSG